MRGLYIVQPKHDEVELIELMGVFFSPSVKEAFVEAYQNLEDAKAACICRDEQTPWLIVVLSDDPRQIRRSTLHEVVHLADKLVHTKEMRARFVEHVYFALTDSL